MPLSIGRRLYTHNFHNFQPHSHKFALSSLSKYLSPWFAIASVKTAKLASSYKRHILRVWGIERMWCSRRRYMTTFLLSSELPKNLIQNLLMSAIVLLNWKPLKSQSRARALACFFLVQCFIRSCIAVFFVSYSFVVQSFLFCISGWCTADAWWHHHRPQYWELFSFLRNRLHTNVHKYS